MNQAQGKQSTWRSNVHINLASFPYRWTLLILDILIGLKHTLGQVHDLASFDESKESVFNVEVAESCLQLLASTEID